MLALEQLQVILAQEDRFEQLALIKNMVKSLTDIRKTIENGLVEDGLAYYQVQVIKEHVVREHERNVFKKL